MKVRGGESFQREGQGSLTTVAKELGRVEM